VCVYIRYRNPNHWTVWLGKKNYITNVTDYTALPFYLGLITFLYPSSRSVRTWAICISGAVVNQFQSCLITLI
jgi:hypothetical protein